MPKALVIVESPAKARTISRFLDDDYVVESSIGHIRDLPESAREIPEAVKKQPWSRLGIDVEHDFRPLYVIPEDKKKQVAKLKKLLKDADRLYLATDEDREGESISWHLREVLQPKVPTQRLVFHEITREAIDKALRSPRDIDGRLVTAQETRRLLDRLYGYEISPLLWRKIAPQLSAGRVQSVAVRVVVERERERMRFHPATYWDLTGTFAARGGQAFDATLVSLDGQRLATGKDFDDATGRLRSARRNVVHLDEAGAQALRERLAAADFRVTRVERKPYTTAPPPPFTTSTLQQEANRKLGLGSRDTMRLAQGLYENGHITYMRTDSTTLSDQALRAARAQIGELYGRDYLPDSPREYKARVRNAQEAHEAIRPAGESFRRPETLRSELDPRALRLYEMIWKRTVASQMANARGQRLVVQVTGDDAVFQATGRTIEFPGYLRAYVEGSDDPEAELGDQEKVLPPLDEGQGVDCRDLAARDHTTQPPARYTEASLIKELEKEGIGRPSTYATIIDTIQRREYVQRKGNALVPTFTAFAVVRLMEEYFTHLVDLDFTARMEDSLDAISRGEKAHLPYLHAFYDGEGQVPGLKQLLKAEIDPRHACTIPLAPAGNDEPPVNVRIGKYGPYLEADGSRAPLPVGITPDELTPAKARELLERGARPDVLGTDPASGRPVYLKSGRYGPYVQLGEQDDQPKMKSLLPGQQPEDVTLADALQLLSLPRPVGEDPETGEEILADLGRYGPYLRRGRDTRSLPSAESLFSITVDEAAAIFRTERAGRRGSTQIADLGPHPDSGEPVRVMTGRFGPYVTDGSVNASVPRNTDPKALSLQEAVELIAKRAAKGPASKPARGRRAASGKSGAKSAAKGRAKSGTRSTGGKAAAERTGGAASSTTRARGSRSTTGGAKGAKEAKGKARTTRKTAPAGQSEAKSRARQGSGQNGRKRAPRRRAG